MITPEQASRAVELLKICRYFPSSDLQRLQISSLLIDMVETKEQLDWLVKEQSMRDWDGPGELRKLLLSRFPARDAAEQDPEQAYLEREAAATDRRIAGWKAEQKLLGDAQVVIDVTPAIKSIDRTTADLRFERVQQLLGKEIKPTYHPESPKRTPEERAEIIREMEVKLGIAALDRKQS